MQRHFIQHKKTSMILMGVMLLLTSISAMARIDAAAIRSGGNKFISAGGAFSFDPLHIKNKQVQREGTPLLFLENKGQVTDQHNKPRTDIDYALHAAGNLSIFVGNGAIHYQFYHNNNTSQAKAVKDRRDPSTLEHRPEATSYTMYRMDVALVGANRHAQKIAEQSQEYVENYFTTATGNSGAIARSFKKVTYKDVYPNIDWVLYSNGSGIKHEFIVRKGGKVSDIKLRYNGAKSLSIANNGNLAAGTPYGDITEEAPFTYQRDGRNVKSRFVLRGNILSYETGNYDGELVIDPSLAWATYYGGSGIETAEATVTDAAGNIYISGLTTSLSNIATSGSGEFKNTYTPGPSEIYLAKFSGNGTRLWATYYGGSNDDVSKDLAVDASNNVYMAGYTYSSSGIATSGAGEHQSIFGGATTDGFLVKFNSNGTRLWATYYGGEDKDYATGVAVDASNNVYLTGISRSYTGIATSGAGEYKSERTNDFYDEAFLAKFNSNGTRLWATYYGGDQHDGAYAVAVDGSNNVYMAGYTYSDTGIATVGAGEHQAANAGGPEIFLVKFNSVGARQWGTYYGGPSGEYLGNIATAPGNKVYLAGYSYSTSGIATSGAGEYQPTIGGEYDAFVAKFDGGGAREWATYYGGLETEEGADVATDATGNIYLVGYTESDNGISSMGAGVIQASRAGGRDVFLVKFTASGTRAWATYYGSTERDEGLALSKDAAGNLYIAGQTESSSGFATTGSGEFSSTYMDNNDAFLLKIAPLPQITGNKNVCAGTTTQLSHETAGGAWSSANTTIATVNPSGAVTGIMAGQVAISYSTVDGTTTTTVTVHALPNITSIGSNSPVCAGTALALNSTASGAAPLSYSWTGPNGFSQTGNSTGIPSSTMSASGIYTLIVTDGNTCANTATTNATVNGRPAITSIGNNAPVCESQVLSLSATVTGGAPSYSYSWTGPNGFTSIDEDPFISPFATVAMQGTYTLTVTDANNCTATGANTTGVVVHPMQPITGSATVLFGQTITLSNPVAGGTWGAAAPWRTSVGNSSGIVKGISVGESLISYTNVHGCTSLFTVTTLSGTNACVGQTITLSDGNAGGTWTSSNGSIATVATNAGIVTGVNAGKATITHFQSGGGITTTTVTVNPLSPTSGPTSGICQGQSLTLTNNTPGGGTWYSGNTSIAVVNSSGIVTGISGGTITIYYTPVAGCATTKNVTILATTPITGASTVCVGQTITVSNSTPGGVWSSSSGALATVSSSGVVGGVAAGMPRISYVWPTGCLSTTTVTVYPLSQTTGGAVVCKGQSITFANTTPGGGAWSSNNAGIAAVAGGVVTGAGAGAATISFTTTSGCVAVKPVTVNPTPAITGATNVCVGQTINVSNSMSGGNWSSSNGSIASISAPTLVKGIGAGTARVSYIISATGCHATHTVTVNALSPITGGTPAICASNSMTLANATPFGGVWSSSNSSAATVSSSGFVKGTGVGMTVISFTTAAGGCVATRTVTVNACREAAAGEPPSVNEATAANYDVQLFPNPNNGSFTLSGTTGDDEVMIDVLNVVGQVIQSETIKPEHGSINTRITLDRMCASGTYLLRLHSSKRSKTLHFVISN